MRSNPLVHKVVLYAKAVIHTCFLIAAGFALVVLVAYAFWKIGGE